MPRRPFIPVLALCLAFLAVAPAAEAAEHYLGGGVRYFQTLDDIEIDNLGKIDTDGNSFILSYLADPAGLLKVEVDLEYFGRLRGRQTGEVFSPQFLLLVGGQPLRRASGPGSTTSRTTRIGDDTSDVFYIGRLGLQFTLLPRLHLDSTPTTRPTFSTRSSTAPTRSSITLGAMVRFRIR